MSSEVMISVQGLRKDYLVFDQPFKRIVQLFWPDNNRLYRTHTALADVDFEIQRGETIGIVGRNGSGKSTLLEILTGTLQQTQGDITVNGKVSALLELGAGFNPEFTGRENVFLSAAITGVDRDTIDKRFDEIATFSGIGEYIDLPVKTYSSGMYVRLAFATAINLDAEILIVDEALAVGDLSFQRKCFRKFEELRNQGVTILFVTHSVNMIRNLCNRALLLDQGQIKKIGDPQDVVHEYMRQLFSRQDSNRSIEQQKLLQNIIPGSRELSTNPEIDSACMRATYNESEYRWGDQRAIILDYRLLVDDQESDGVIPQGSKIRLQYSVFSRDSVGNPIYGVTIKTIDGITVYGANTRSRGMQVEMLSNQDLVQVEFEFFANLITGHYFISIGVAEDDNTLDNCAVDRRYDLVRIFIDGQQEDFGLADLQGDFKVSARHPVH